MIGKRIAIAAAIGLLVLAGCDDRSKSSARSNQTAVPSIPQPSSTLPDPKPPMAVAAHIPAATPATKPAEPPHSSLNLSDSRSPQPLAFNFPPARLHIDRETKTAVLYSDDPKNAIESNYAGNSYYMVIKLGDDFADQLGGYQWHYRAISDEHEDSTNGIFLEGQRYYLQPTDMTVTFTGNAPVMTVMLSGTFSEFDMAHNSREGMTVHVNGIVSAVVDPPK
ncbi:MAG TPA: hypothetical protein VFE47_08820 [Tepidisphaeraceae bacterium]|nr:hypothetical protein [Tepidisphaeraceae bacterium]